MVGEQGPTASITRRAGGHCRGGDFNKNFLKYPKGWQVDLKRREVTVFWSGEKNKLLTKGGKIRNKMKTTLSNIPFFPLQTNDKGKAFCAKSEPAGA